jgi:predicted DNA binding CopG/RHH family protein
MTPGTLARVPNQPKTPQRTVRISDELWSAAKAKAEERGDELSAVIRAALERYVKRK